MSIRYVERAIWAKGLGKTNKAVLIAIADAVSDNGIGWLLISSLMKKTDLSERAIQGAIAEMCSTHDGTVQPILERRERAKRSSIFRIHLERIPQHDHGVSEKEMTADEMWGAGDAPMKVKGAGDAPHPRTGCTQPPQGMHPEPSLEPSTEPIPPLPSGEAPHGEDLLGDIEPADSRSVPLVDYVVEGWAKLKEEHPQIAAIRTLNDSRRKKIGARAGEVARGAPGMTLHDVWDQIFTAIRGSTWLQGREEPGRGYTRPFTLTLDKILEPAFFLQTLERAANDAEHNRTSSDPSTGRQYGPAEQAMRNAIARLRSSQQSGR